MGGRAAIATLIACHALSCGGRVEERTTPRLTGSPQWFVVERIEFGGGMDVDGRNTTAEQSKTSTNTCRRVAGSPTRVLEDAPYGVDNNFVKHLLPASGSGDTNLQLAFDRNLAGGGPTLLIELEHGIAPDAMITARIHVASAAGILEQAPLEIPEGRMREAVYEGVSRLGHRLVLPFAYGAATGALVIEQVFVRFDLRENRATLASVLRADSLFVVRPPRGPWCTGTATAVPEQLMATMRVSADLTLSSPAAPDPGRDCDGISLGATLTLHRIEAPVGRVPLPAIPALPCD